MGRELADTAKNYERLHGGNIRYGTSVGQLVCNQFVIACIRETYDRSFPNITADDFVNSPHFMKVNAPAAGDLIHWSGHIGIVTDPDHGLFWGSQSSTGVAEAHYKGASYWNGDYGGREPDYFLRWIH